MMIKNTLRREEGDELDDIAVAQLPAASHEYNLDTLLAAIESDMTLLADMLSRVYQHLSPQTFRPIL